MELIVIKPRDPDQRNFLLELIRQLGIQTQLYPEKPDEELLPDLVEEAIVSGIKPEKVMPGNPEMTRIDELITEIEKLDYSGRITLISRLLTLLKGEPHTSGDSVFITRLRGLGKEIWRRTNTDTYTTDERETWES